MRIFIRHAYKGWKGREVTEDRFETCIRAMNRGNRDALKEVYEEYVSYIYRVVRGMLPNREEAEDVTSEFFIRLWEKSHAYKPGNGHKGWMATIARNLAIDHIRRYRREEVTEDIVLEGDTGGDTCLPEEQVISDITIQEALSGLKDAERQVIHMKIMGELTFQEIAYILQVPLGTVSWRYREALKKLRRCGFEESGRGI